jgi:hypothetical protein
MFKKDVKDVTINKDNFTINQAYEIEIHSFSTIQKRVVIVTDIDDHKLTCLCHDKSVMEIRARDIWVGDVKITGSIGVRYSDDWQEKNFVVEDSIGFFNEEYWNKHKGDEYMVWYINNKTGMYERFIGKFDSILDKNELCFWTYGGGKILNFLKDPDTMVIIPIEEIIDSKFLSDAPPIDWI